MSFRCKHWRLIDAKYQHGHCSIGLHERRDGSGPKTISPNICFDCAQWDGPSRGAGDRIHAVIQAAALTIGGKKLAKKLKGCGGCGKRRKRLNEWSRKGKR